MLTDSATRGKMHLNTSIEVEKLSCVCVCVCLCTLQLPSVTSISSLITNHLYATCCTTSQHILYPAYLYCPHSTTTFFHITISPLYIDLLSPSLHLLTVPLRSLSLSLFIISLLIWNAFTNTRSFPPTSVAHSSNSSLLFQLCASFYLPGLSSQFPHLLNNSSCLPHHTSFLQ